MEILDVLDFDGASTPAKVDTDANLVFSAARPNKIWFPGYETVGFMPELYGVDVSNPSDLHYYTTIPYGEDPSYIPADKQLYGQGYHAMVQRTDNDIFVVGYEDVAIFDMSALSFLKGRKFTHPEGLVMRMRDACIVGVSDIVGVADSMDSASIFETNVDPMARVNTFTTWDSVDTVYGVTNVIKDTASGNLMNGAIAVQPTPYTREVLVVSALGSYVVWVSWATKAAPVMVGTPLYLGDYSDFGAIDSVLFRSSYMLVSGGVYSFGPTYPDATPQIKTVGNITNPTFTKGALTLVSEYVNTDLTGSYLSGMAVWKDRYVIAPVNGDNPGLLAIDYNDPANPQTVEFLSDIRFYEQQDRFKMDIIILGDIAYIRTWKDADGTTVTRIISVDLTSLLDVDLPTYTAAVAPSWAIGLDMTAAAPASGGVDPTEMPNPVLSYDSRDWVGGTVVTPSDPDGTNRIVGSVPNRGTAGSFYDLPVRMRRQGTLVLLEAQLQAEDGSLAWNEAEFPLESDYWDDLGGSPESAPMTFICVSRGNIPTGTNTTNDHFKFDLAANTYQGALYDTYLGAYTMDMTFRHYSDYASNNTVEIDYRAWLEDNFNLEYDPYIYEEMVSDGRYTYDSASDLMSYNYYAVVVENTFDENSVTKYFGIPYDGSNNVVVGNNYSHFGPGDLDEKAYHSRHQNTHTRLGWYGTWRYNDVPLVQGQAWDGISGAAMYRAALTEAQIKIAAGRLGVAFP